MEHLNLTNKLLKSLVQYTTVPSGMKIINKLEDLASQWFTLDGETIRISSHIMKNITNGVFATGTLIGCERKQGQLIQVETIFELWRMFRLNDPQCLQAFPDVEHLRTQQEFQDTTDLYGQLLPSFKKFITLNKGCLEFLYCTQDKTFITSILKDKEWFYTYGFRGESSEDVLIGSTFVYLYDCSN